MAEKVHTEHGYNFPQVFDEIWNHGIIIKGPEYFLMGYELPEHQAWVVWWASCAPHLNPYHTFLRLMPHYQPWVGWARGRRPGSKYRFYSTDRLLRHIARHGSTG